MHHLDWTTAHTARTHKWGYIRRMHPHPPAARLGARLDGTQSLQSDCRLQTQRPWDGAREWPCLFFFFSFCYCSLMNRVLKLSTGLLLQSLGNLVV